MLESDFSVPSSLQYHDKLNPAIWNPDQTMKSDVRDAMLKSANAFIEELAPNITPEMVKDICLTGSNANYNYTIGSDCDVHIMIDFPDKMYEDFALAKKTVWNKQYHVSIHGFPVEMYPQSAKETIVSGSGWYSIKSNRWLTQPVHHDDVDVTNPAIIQTANKIGRQIQFVIEYNINDMRVLHRLGEKIWGLRDQATNGEFSINNLAFKELRNAGWTDKYINYMNDVQSKLLSIE